MYKKKKKNELLDLVNIANGIDLPEEETTQDEQEAVEFVYDVETFVPKKDKTTGMFNILHVFINSETLEAHIEVEPTNTKSKSSVITKVSDKLRKLYQRGQYE